MRGRPFLCVPVWLTALAAIVLLAVTVPAVAQDSVRIGTVSRIKGQVVAVRGEKRVPLAVGGAVFRDDVLKTGLLGRVEVTLNDETVLTLTDRTTLTVENYDFPGPDSRARFNLRLGAIRAVSGAIAEKNPEGFVVTTPVATIGIRGTDFWAGTLEAAFNVVLISGKGVYVENARGRVELTQAGQGTVIEVPGVRPPEPDAPEEDVSVILGEMAREALGPAAPAVLPAARLSAVLGSVQF